MTSPTSCGNLSDIMLSSPGSSSDGSCDEPMPKRPTNSSQSQKPGLLRTRKKASSSSSSSSSKSSSKASVQAKDKEPHLVQRRNARERKRVSLVNDGFIRLRRKIPTEPRNKKLSKVKTLRSAINYIMHLQEVLDEESNRQQRLEELENLGMTIPLQHAPPHQGYEWAPYTEPPAVVGEVDCFKFMKTVEQICMKSVKRFTSRHQKQLHVARTPGSKQSRTRYSRVSHAETNTLLHQFTCE